MARHGAEIESLRQQQTIDRALVAVALTNAGGAGSGTLGAMQSGSSVGETFLNGTFVNPNAPFVDPGNPGSGGGGGNGTGSPDEYVFVSYWVAGDVVGTKPMAP